MDHLAVSVGEATLFSFTAANATLDPVASTYYMIPFSSNNHFVGREETLNTLKDLVFNQESQRVALVGL